MQSALCQRQPRPAQQGGRERPPAARSGGGPREEVTHFDFGNARPTAQGQAAGLPAGFLQGGGVGLAGGGLAWPGLGGAGCRWEAGRGWLGSAGTDDGKVGRGPWR